MSRSAWKQSFDSWENCTMRGRNNVHHWARLWIVEWHCRPWSESLWFGRSVIEARRTPDFSAWYRRENHIQAMTEPFSSVKCNVRWIIEKVIDFLEWSIRRFDSLRKRRLMNCIVSECSRMWLHCLISRSYRGKIGNSSAVLNQTVGNELWSVYFDYINYQ
jgi:hypothetical protein